MSGVVVICILQPSQSTTALSPAHSSLLPLQDSGVDYGDELSHFESQVSNPGQCDGEMDFDYTDNVAYWKVVTPNQGVGVRDGVQKQPVGVTAWDMGVPERPLEVTLRQVPNCRDKEFVVFKQPPRVPARSQASSNSLQTTL